MSPSPVSSAETARLKEHTVGTVLILLLLSSGFLFVATTLSARQSRQKVLRDNRANATSGCVATTLVARGTNEAMHCLSSTLTSVDTTADGHMVEIPSQIGLLSRLTHLSFTGEYIQGTIPSEIGQLSGLRSLRIHNTQLTGGVPTELGRLTALTSLHITHNHNISTTKWWDAIGNAAPSIQTGMPTELSRLTLLRELSLAGNGLVGTSPYDLFSHLTSLTFLDVSNNALTGVLPRLPLSLKFLYIGRNQLSGRLALHTFPIPNLVALDAGNNLFTGLLPTQVSNMTDLEYLMLSSNNFAGTIPEAWGNLSNLQWLDLSNNTLLSGTIPGGIDRLDQMIHVEGTSITV